MDGNNSAVQDEPGDEDLDQPLSRFVTVYLGLSRFVTIYFGLSRFFTVYLGLPLLNLRFSWLSFIYLGGLLWITIDV